MATRENRTDATTLGEGKFLRLVRQGKWEFCERHGSTGVVGIVATTAVGEIVLVEQWRDPVGARCVELPAGLVGDDGMSESSADAAGRELEEETGYRAEVVTPLISNGCVSAGLTSETVDLVRAENVVKTGDGGGLEGEEIEVHLVPLAEIDTFLQAKQQDGRLVDFKVWAGLWFCRGGGRGGGMGSGVGGVDKRD